MTIFAHFIEIFISILKRYAVLKHHDTIKRGCVVMYFWHGLHGLHG